MGILRPRPTRSGRMPSLEIEVKRNCQLEVTGSTKQIAQDGQNGRTLGCSGCESEDEPQGHCIDLYKVPFDARHRNTLSLFGQGAGGQPQSCAHRHVVPLMRIIKKA